MPKQSFFLKFSFVVLLVSPLFGCNDGPELKVSVSHGNTFQGTALNISNADRGAVEIKDIVINDRDECTFTDMMSEAVTKNRRWPRCEIFASWADVACREKSRQCRQAADMASFRLCMVGRPASVKANTRRKVQCV